MTPEIWVALITGAASVIAVMITNKKSNSEIMQQLAEWKGITDTKIEELTREVRLHNDFATRIPVLDERIKTANNRIHDLEEYHK